MSGDAVMFKLVIPSEIKSSVMMNMALETWYCLESSSFITMTLLSPS